LAGQGAPRHLTEVVLRGPRDECLVDSTETPAFALLKACDAYLRWRLQKNDDIESVFQVIPPTLDRARDNKGKIGTQVTAEQRGTFSGIALCLEGRIGGQPKEVVCIDEVGFENPSNGSTQRAGT
jgi:hypothetical protein